MKDYRRLICNSEKEKRKCPIWLEFGVVLTRHIHCIRPHQIASWKKVTMKPIEPPTGNTTYWQLIFLRSKVNGAAYNDEALARHNWWNWPKNTYFQRRLHQSKFLQPVAQNTTRTHRIDNNPPCSTGPHPPQMGRRLDRRRLANPRLTPHDSEQA
jgi:hypothetical protein